MEAESAAAVNKVVAGIAISETHTFGGSQECKDDRSWAAKIRANTGDRFDPGSGSVLLDINDLLRRRVSEVPIGRDYGGIEFASNRGN